MMALDRLLDGMEVEVELLAVGDARGNGSRDETSTPRLRYTRSGSGVLELAGGASLRFSRRSVTVVPAPRRANQDGNGGGLLMAAFHDPKLLTVSVRVRATYRGAANVFDHLAEPLEEPCLPDDPIVRSLEEFVEEITAHRPGCRTMAGILLRRSLILFLRRCFERRSGSLRWLTALEDTRLGRAVAAMHERPAHSFTLSELAEVAGMSRSVFAARFNDVLDQSPIEFLKTLRLARAMQLLTGTDLPVKAVAAQVGYSSRSSFTRAFVASHGAAPRAFRAASDRMSA
jgi:AraC family transcriptional regulator, activator of mtrCDE